MLAWVREGAAPSIPLAQARGVRPENSPCLGDSKEIPGSFSSCPKKEKSLTSKCKALETSAWKGAEVKAMRKEACKASETA
jgi:hypothetical protein